MTCMLARPKLAAYADDQLRPAESAAVRDHLVACEECHQEYEYQARLGSPLRELPAVEPPAELALAIRLRLSDRTTPWQRWQVRLANLMRPVALPAAGGLLTALILYGVLIPAVYSRAEAASTAQDVPTTLVTAPSFKGASPFLVTEDLLIEAWIDERGNITNFEVVNPSHSAAVEKMLLLNSANLLLTTRFAPATRFGQPTPGKVLFSLRRINIRG